MVEFAFLDYVVVAGLSAALPLFAIATRRCRGSAFAAVLAPLVVVLALGVATVAVDLVPVTVERQRALRLAFVGAAAVLSALSATRLVWMTTGRWSA